ncbi:MAG: hypothetical protein ABIR17_11840 [Pseudolysinimonas sp.]|uniref:hypothetical protein n=1 Tax=Pseudolysinimonas sp. TaxID=2680009 RepID=UPI0032665E4D
MTEITPTAIEPASPNPVSPIRSRRRLVIGIGAGLVVAAVALIGVRITLNAVNANAIALYASEAEHYSVEAPGTPTQKQEEVVQPLAVPTTATHWTDGDLYYSVSSADRKNLPPSPAFMGMFLGEVLVGALSDAPGVSASSLESSAINDALSTEPDQITLSGDPAYRFSMTVEGAPARFYVIFTGHGTRLYLLVYSESADSRDDEFVDSFTFVD